ncbi:MAG: hypothetical protein ACYTGH_15780, partial [Planctomycetota bacterium]
QQGGGKRPYNPIGSHGFDYEGAAYYTTARDSNSLCGTQLRVYNARTWIRITTREQALIDTLLQPERCGGAAIVYEAWSNAGETLDQHLLCSHLKEIGNNLLTRRIGCMMQEVGIPPVADLEEYLQVARKDLKQATSPEPANLLAGYDGNHFNAGWGLNVGLR